MKCKCGGPLSSDSNFCPKCGQPQRAEVDAAEAGTCRVCHVHPVKENDDGSGTCTLCGWRLAASARSAKPQRAKVDADAGTCPKCGGVVKEQDDGSATCSKCKGDLTEAVKSPEPQKSPRSNGPKRSGIIVWGGGFLTYCFIASIIGVNFGGLACLVFSALYWGAIGRYWFLTESGEMSPFIESFALKLERLLRPLPSGNSAARDLTPLFPTNYVRENSRMKGCLVIFVLVAVVIGWGMSCDRSEFDKLPEKQQIEQYVSTNGGEGKSYLHFSDAVVAKGDRILAKKRGAQAIAQKKYESSPEGIAARRAERRAECVYLADRMGNAMNENNQIKGYNASQRWAEKKCADFNIPMTFGVIAR